MNFLNKYKLIRYLISGGLAALIEYIVFLLLLFSRFDTVVAQGVSFLCGLGVSFLLSKRWVFTSRGSAKQEFMKYFLLAVVNLVIGSLVIYILVDVILFPSWISKIGVMGMVACWNYLIFQKLIFRHSN